MRRSVPGPKRDSEKKGPHGGDPQLGLRSEFLDSPAGQSGDDGTTAVGGGEYAWKGSPVLAA